MSGYRLVITYRERPWWALRLLEREREFSMQSPPGATREYVESMRRMVLAADGCVGARIEETA